MPPTDGLHYTKRGGYHLIVDPLAPNWLATNDDGAWIVRHLRAAKSRDDIAYRYAKRRAVGLEHALRVVRNFADEVSDFVSPPPRPPYEGRGRYLEPDRLREV